MVKLNSTQEIIGTDVLDHLGLVAATIDKLGIAKQIDKLMPMTNNAKTTMGQRATAMILNGLGFIDDRLYMFPKFLENKPVAKLFGTDLKASDFNDDALGRFLDEAHAYGETKLYSEIALPIALRQQLLANDETVPSQSNKETNKPSMKWVYRLFHGIHVLQLNLNNQMQHIVLNLNELLRRIVIYFGDFACNIYGITTI